MTSKRTKETKKDRNIHKTAKNKSSGGKEKGGKTGKTTDTRISNNEIRNTSKSTKTKEKPQSKKEKQQNSAPEKQSSEKTLIIDDGDLEGMTVPPKSDPSSSPRPVAGAGAGADQKPPVRPPQTSPRRPPSRPASAPATKPAKRPPQAKPPRRAEKEESSEDDDEVPDTPVKQFSFPAYKILSGASVAPVQMFPQKVVVNQHDPEPTSSWATAFTGLFQTSKLSLKTRILRLFLIWVFCRVLNKQTAWLSDVLGIGIPDELPPPPRERPPPGEKFVRVFREGDPNPFHVRVKRPV